VAAGSAQNARMAQIINFNKARKRRQREEAEQHAAANRLKFGRSKLERQRDTQESEAAQHKLDQLRREPPDET
jgi:hypothetical protein